MRPKLKITFLLFFSVTIFIFLLSVTSSAQAVVNDFCLTKKACWTDGICETYKDDGHYGGFCTNGTFNPWCESGTDWKFWYPTCGQINYNCTYSEFITDSPKCGSGTANCSWQQQACSTADSCTASQPYLNPGLCRPEDWNNIPANASQACQISSGIYKTCCNSDGTLDGNCTGGNYTGTCPAGKVTVQCGFGGLAACGQDACQTIAPQATSTPIPTLIPDSCAQPVCIPGTESNSCTSNSCGGNYCEEEVQICRSDGCGWDDLPTQCSDSYSTCGTCSSGTPPPDPTPTSAPANCNYGDCGVNGCSSTQRYISGSGCPSWYTGPGCYQDQSCTTGGNTTPKPPPRVWTCLRVSKNNPTGYTDCTEDIAKAYENQPALVVSPGDLIYADLFFKPIGNDLKSGAKAEIFFKEQGVTPALKDITRYCWNPAWETAGGDRIWLPDLIDTWGNGSIAARGCQNPAPWDGIDGNLPCKFANQSWNYDKPFTCSDNTTDQHSDSWGTIGGSTEYLGVDSVLRKSPQKYLQTSVSCNGTICGEGDQYMADGSIYHVRMPIRIKSNIPTNTTVRFRGAVTDGWYVNPSAYLGPMVNPTLCGNFAANFSERTPQNGWGGGGGTPFVPQFQGCDPYEGFEMFTFFSNWVSVSSGPLSIPTSPSAQCPTPGNRANISWDLVPGATSYNVRVDDNTLGNGANAIDNSGNIVSNNCTPHDVCINGWTGTTMRLNTVPGHSFSWWVHACNSAGCSTQMDGSPLTCAATPPTPIPTLTPTSILTPTTPPTPTPRAWLQTEGGDVHSNR